MRFLAAFLVAFAAWAQVAVPPLKGRVNDLTGTLSAEQTASLERMLEVFEKRKGSQIAVLMVPTTGEEEIEQFSIRVAEAWQIGRGKVDDGAILVVAKDDRELRIEVGYGLEGALPDAIANRIVEDVIVPRFRQGDFYGGISAGLDRMIRVIEGEPLPAPARGAPQGRGGGIGQLLPVFLILSLVVGGLLRAVLGRVFGSVVTGGAIGFLAWLLAGALAVAILAAIIGFFITLVGGGRMGRRYYGGFPGGFGGGMRRGGFGGGFGGGGASGRW